MIKKLIPIVLAILFVVGLFILTYSITLKNKMKENEPSGQAPVINSDIASESENQPTDTTAQTKATTEAPSVSNRSGELTEFPKPIIVNMPGDNTWSLVLVNAFYQMNGTYEPQLTKVSDDPEIYLEERVAEQYKKMTEAAKESGLVLTLAAGYASLDRQTRKFETQIQDLIDEGYPDEAARVKALYTVMPARQNEANYGLSVDIGWMSDDFKNSPGYTWLKEHAAEYGFIERYPSDKTEFTHFAPQPWHWRYVGADYAKEMISKNMCLEEYCGKVN